MQECRDTPGRPLNKYPGQEEESVCKGCALLPTKPENIPEELWPHVAAALNLSELNRLGATFSYPHSLTAVEWASLSGLQRGRDKADKLQKDRDRKKPKPK